VFSAAVQFCKGRYTNTSLYLWLIVMIDSSAALGEIFSAGQKKGNPIMCMNGRSEGDFRPVMDAAHKLNDI